MKAALILLSLFFLMVTFRARAFDDSTSSTIERQINSLLETKDQLVSQIDTRSLAIREYLSYGIYKESCIKLSELFTRIKSDSNKFSENSDQLMRHLKSCSQGVDGLAFLYSQQKTH
jgi:hypothetical protein